MAKKVKGKNSRKPNKANSLKDWVGKARDRIEHRIDGLSKDNLDVACLLPILAEAQRQGWTAKAPHIIAHGQFRSGKSYFMETLCHLMKGKWVAEVTLVNFLNACAEWKIVGMDEIESLSLLEKDAFWRIVRLSWSSSSTRRKMVQSGGTWVSDEKEMFGSKLVPTREVPTDHDADRGIIFGSTRSNRIDIVDREEDSWDEEDNIGKKIASKVNADFDKKDWDTVYTSIKDDQKFMDEVGSRRYKFWKYLQVCAKLAGVKLDGQETLRYAPELISMEKMYVQGVVRVYQGAGTEAVHIDEFISDVNDSRQVYHLPPMSKSELSRIMTDLGLKIARWTKTSKHADLRGKKAVWIPKAEDE